MTPESLTQYIQDAKKGDADAFYSAFSQYEQLIYKIAYTHLTNQQDALDAVQETAYLSYKNIGKLRDPASFKAWLCKIAVNASMDILRQRKPVGSLDEAIEVADAGAQGEYSEVEFVDCLRSLSEHEKDILLLKLYSDFTFEMIAKKKGVPINTVKTTYYRAIEKLRVAEGIV